MLPFLRQAALRQIIRERAVLCVLAVALWWAIYVRVLEGYGAGSAVIAATCTSWGYVIISLYAAYLLNGRNANSDSPRGPQAPGGRWPGARP